MSRALAAVLLLSAGLAGCASAPRGPQRVTVEAEGWAAEAKGDAHGPRSRALADAQKRAVEKAAGVSVAAVTRVEKGVAVKQRVRAHARGRIERWDVLEERHEDGFHKLRLRAVVRLEPPGAPAPVPADARLRVSGEGPAADGLRRGLIARGFDLVESGEEFTADARASAKVSRDPRLAPFVSGRARVTVSVKDPSGAVVWQETREAARLDADPLLAAAAASETAAELAARDAASGLAEALWDR